MLWLASKQASNGQSVNSCVKQSIFEGGKSLSTCDILKFLGDTLNTQFDFSNNVKPVCKSVIVWKPLADWAQFCQSLLSLKLFTILYFL